MQRGGFPMRTIVLALFVVGTVYLLYLYNTTLGRLRDAELTAERYRREEETKTAQLQVSSEQIARLKDDLVAKVNGVMRSKDELQEKCDSEKREFTNRLNSLNQQHKMLKSQNDEHEVEQMRLEQETRRLREDFDQVEQQRNQEYQALKAEKELEVSSLKDQVANYQRQNEQLQTQITSLREQLQNGQSQVEYDRALIQKMEQDVAALQHQLAVKSAQLVQQGQGQAMQQGQGQGQAMLGQGQAGFGVNQQLNFNNAQQQGILQQQQLNQQHQQQLFGQGLGQQEGVANMNIGAAGGNNMAFQQQQQDGLNVGQAQGGLNQEEQQEALDNVNQQHQMVPPNNPAIPDAPVNGNVDGRPMHQQEVVVKDEDHQVQPPNFNADAGAKDGSREGAGAGGMLGVADEQHKDPLALQQIVQPNVGDHGEREMEGEEKEKDEDEEDDNIMRQVPPVNDVKFGHNAAEEEEEEEEGDHYRDDDKYEDDARDDGGNNNVHINQNPNNIPDADYA